MINEVLYRNHRSIVTSSVEMRNKEAKITFRQFRYISRLLMTFSKDKKMRRYFNDFIEAALTLNMKEASLLIRVLLGTLKYERYLKRKEKVIL